MTKSEIKTKNVLMQLADGTAKYGLDLLDGSAGGLRRASMYVFLASLEAEGFIEGREEPSGIAPRRRYTITDAGRQWLKDQS